MTPHVAQALTPPTLGEAVEAFAVGAQHLGAHPGAPLDVTGGGRAQAELPPSTPDPRESPDAATHAKRQQPRDTGRMSVHLLGGGRDIDRCGDLLRPFVAEARQRAADRTPVIAVLLVLEAADDPRIELHRAMLEAAGAAPGEIRVVSIVEGELFDAAALEADALFVGGGLTPAYLDAFGKIRDAVTARVREGVQYAGFSAGSAIAAGPALVGGYRVRGVEVGSEDAAEELDEVEVRPGLGLLDFAVDVHAAQWGTLSRLVAAIDAGLVTEGVAIDEHTALVMSARAAPAVRGRGQVWRVESAASGVHVQVLRA
ncbi:Type 1 glutamine amidotransferase-like domain-containing protein [uncultured Microbacterium sp.]|uniref:Type 1 glutamine amidotransferase-like domain-containing protein n=1 Tax=uncultured Microbacterium sp. TaxID=191216 RepID=UPI0025CCDDBB|nr:Type 1 glutamine amidotransferase-like domain-containing protein [uncultured Microbacterium sp.]